MTACGFKGCSEVAFSPKLCAHFRSAAAQCGRCLPENRPLIVEIVWGLTWWCLTFPVRCSGTLSAVWTGCMCVRVNGTRLVRVARVVSLMKSSVWWGTVCQDLEGPSWWRSIMKTWHKPLEVVTSQARNWTHYATQIWFQRCCNIILSWSYASSKAGSACCLLNTV